MVVFVVVIAAPLCVVVAEAYYELELAVARVEFLQAGSPECLDRQIPLIEDNWKTPL